MPFLGTPVVVEERMKLELKMFYQTYTACKAPNVKVKGQRLRSPLHAAGTILWLLGGGCLEHQNPFFMVALCNRETIIYFHAVVCSSFFSSPNLSRRRLDVCHTSTHGVALRVNLGCRSETCCMRLAENSGRQKSSKTCHLGTIAQLCRAISSQLRHISTIGKKTR